MTANTNVRVLPVPAGAEPSTRERVLAAAWKIIDEKGEAGATMRAVAKLANVSRQAVYLHFADRSHLLSSLSGYVDEKVGLGGWMKDIEDMGDGRAMLRRLGETRAQRSQVLASLVRSIEADRYRDEAAAAAWKRRQELNVVWMAKTVVRKLAEEGRVHPSWDHKEAATLLVTLYSFRAWDDLTQARDWPVDRYVEVLAAAAASILAGPSSPQPSGA